MNKRKAEIFMYIYTSKSTPGKSEDDDEMVDSCEVNTEDDVDTSMDVSSFCCCLSAHLLNKSLPFLLDVLWTTVSALLASRPVGRMLVPSLLEELDPD